MPDSSILLVNDILVSNGITFGRSETLVLSQRNLLEIYGTDLLEEFRRETLENGIFRSFDKYCQLIFSVETVIIPQFEIVMTFIDCHNNVDAALEFYIVSKNNLNENEKNKFMLLFNEIEELSVTKFAKLEKHVVLKS